MSSAEPPPPSPGAPRLLVVDDEPVIQQLVAEVMFDYQITGALRGGEAIELVSAGGCFDVALVDKNLPDRSGIDVVRELRRLRPELEVILITAYPSFDSALEAIGLGAFDYLVKPMRDINDLRLRLGNAYERVRQRRAERALVEERARAAEERRGLEQRLLVAHRLEALGRLAAGVAHDFGNMLAVIQANGGFVREALGQVTPSVIATAQQDLDSIDQAVQSGVTLTRQLLAFSGRQVVEARAVDLGEVVRSTAGMLARSLGKHVQIVLEIGPDPIVVLADPGQIEQIVTNLAVNARDAMPDGGRLTIALRTAEDGREAVLEVRDTGAGIPIEIRDRIFDPFFTTKSPDCGTGLGLATIQQIVTRAQGRIAVRSEVGAGTTFEIALPTCIRVPRTEVPTTRMTRLRPVSVAS